MNLFLYLFPTIVWVTYFLDFFIVQIWFILINLLKMYTIFTGITYSLVIATLFRKIILLSTGPEISTSFVRKRNRRFLAVIVLFLIFFDMMILIPWTVLSPLVPSKANFKIPVIGECVNMINCMIYFFYYYILLLFYSFNILF